jgi:3-hydroxymyristoyl/3-hydroxydecanoyl-(acyl carrier protein) dehydratase
MHLSLQLAAALTAEMPRPANARLWKLRTVSNMKLRAFIPPGEILQLEASLDDSSDENATITVETRIGKRVVGGACVLLNAEEHP